MAVGNAGDQVRDAAESTPVRTLARGGLIAYGVVWIFVAALGVQVALGRGGQADKAGALEAIAGSGLGVVLLWLITVGLVALVVWQLAEAIWGDRHVSAPGRKLWRRVIHLAEAIAFGVLAYSAGKMAAAGGDAPNKSGAAPGLFGLPGGTALVAAIGVGVLVVAAFLVYRGVTKSFLRDLDLTSADAHTARMATQFGRIGWPALGFAFATVGVLLIIAAFRNNPQQPVGLDAGLKTLAGQPYGPYLLLLLAAGVACFGVYCLFDARYRKS